MSLEKIAELSREFGTKPGYVLAGGGNTSWKDEKFLYIKPSGVGLASIQADDFVKMDRSVLRAALPECSKLPPEEQDAAVVRHAMFAVRASKNGRRPSIEAQLHEMFGKAYVVHLHPTLVNAMTCGKKGREICAKLFPDSAWLGVVNPGLGLAVESMKVFQAWTKKNGKQPDKLFLQNHGVFVAADSPDEIRKIYADIFAKLNDWCEKQGVSAAVPAGTPSDMDFVRENGPVLRGLLAQDSVPAAVSAMNIVELPDGAFTPDHIVYSKSFPLVTDSITKEAVEKFKAEKGYLPHAVIVPGKAMFAAGKDVSDMRTAREFLLDSAAILQVSKAFGGASVMPDAARKFIENWEMESYRSKIAAGGNGGALKGKIALVTGGAQGFGFGISQELVAAGAHVIIADLNKAGADAAAAKFGKNASSVAVDVSNEDSIAAMADEVIRNFGGLDLFVSNAGVLKAGSVKTFEKKAWDFVASVNYTGYFLCVKHFAPMMSKQNAASGLWSDIVQVNSKSGLVGSNKNAAYAAGKFGTIGMTQSFALELVADNIKVNSVCPGNYYDGPLWSDPVRGLFKQYLDAGKVPGAKTVEDVRAHYLKQSPIKRGCFPKDVARAIIYAVTQQFETGQAIPVTGGQVMLN